MLKVNFLFDILAIYQTIEDLDKDFFESNSLDISFQNENFKQIYLNYLKQFNNKQCIDELNDDIIIRYNDKDNNNRIINIVKVILDLLYQNEYISEYQMLYIIRCLNDKLSNILFENVICNLTDENNIESGVINEIIEQEIY